MFIISTDKDLQTGESTRHVEMSSAQHEEFLTLIVQYHEVSWSLRDASYCLFFPAMKSLDFSMRVGIGWRPYK